MVRGREEKKTRLMGRGEKRYSLSHRRGKEVLSYAEQEKRKRMNERQARNASTNRQGREKEGGHGARKNGLSRVPYERGKRREEPTEVAGDRGSRVGKELKRSGEREASISTFAEEEKGEFNAPPYLTGGEGEKTV